MDEQATMMQVGCGKSPWVNQNSPCILCRDALLRLGSYDFKHVTKIKTRHLHCLYTREINAIHN